MLILEEFRHGVVETFLDRTSHLDLAKTDGPTGYWGRRVDQGIRGFQKDNTLRIDGLISPNGPTLQRIGETLSDDLGDGARSSPTPVATHIVAPLPKRRSGNDLDAAASSRPSLMDRVSHWLGRKEFLSAESRSDSRPATAPTARAEPASESKDSGGSVAQAPQAQADRVGAWFEGGPIPGSVTHDDPVSAEKYMRGKVERWRREGLNDAADNLQRYLDGKGGIVPLSRDEARKFAHVRDGEEENKDRFVNATFLARNTKSQSALRLGDMKDGDEIEFQDDWDAKYRFQDAASNYLLGDANFALAYGVNNLGSNGKFTAKRQGDRIAIEGVVRQTWDEPYDFERGQPGAVEGHTLERHGKAKPIVRLLNGSNRCARSSGSGMASCTMWSSSNGGKFATYAKHHPSERRAGNAAAGANATSVFDWPSALDTRNRLRSARPLQS